jgi:hypothetical protein
MYDDPNMLALLDSFGFSEEEVYRVSDELDAYRSIPGTTIARYMNRIINNIDDEDRSAFLKGVMAGLAIKKADDEVSDPYQFNKETSSAKESPWISMYKWNRLEISAFTGGTP